MLPSTETGLDTLGLASAPGRGVRLIAIEAATIFSSGGFFSDESSPVSRMELVEPTCIDRGAPDAFGLVATDDVANVIAPTAIEKAIEVYKLFQHRDESALNQARKALTPHIHRLIEKGERDERRLTVSGLAHLKAIENTQKRRRR
jgi:hypothetical protein